MRFSRLPNICFRVQQPVAYRFNFICRRLLDERPSKVSVKMPKTSPEKTKSLPPSLITFSELDRDLIEFDNLCQELHLSVKERLALLQPIFSKLSTKPGGKTTTILHWFVLFLAALLLMVIVWKKWDYFSWRITAIIRIAMIKILPYFDWRYLKHETCLIPKPFISKAQVEESFNCDLCEAFIDFEDFFVGDAQKQGVSSVIRHYLEVDRPVIVSGAVSHWVIEPPEKFVENLLRDRDFSTSVPCNLFSNFHNSKKSEIDLETLFKKRSHFESFFMHFQNCDLAAMKVLRNVTYRPTVLPEEIAPVTYNWLIWNKMYNPAKYKKLELIEKYAVIGQIFGSTQLKLVPRKNCKDACDAVEGVLPEGYALFFTSLWDVEYLPRGSVDNMAVVLEIQ